MSEHAESRRMRLLEHLVTSPDPQDIASLATELKCDERTIRRDIDFLQQILQKASGIELRRGRVHVSRDGYSAGYFTDQLERRVEAKRAIARTITASLADELAIALTAGSTPYAVATEIRRAAVEGVPPHNLIVFTNSVPSLLELITAGVSTGVIGEIYSSEDCALHTSEFNSAFQPSLAIVGASGVLISNGTGQLDLFSHRAEEAAFLKQVLTVVPEVIVAVDSSKLGKRHPWNFGGAALHGKRVRLVTETLTEEQISQLTSLSERLEASFNTHLTFEQASIN